MVRHNVDFARTRGTEHHDDLAAIDFEIDVLEHVQAAEVLVDALD